MFKNALLYRIEQGSPPDLTAIEDRLAGSRFVECGATQQESAGWVEPRGQDHGALAESVGGQIILKLCTETKAVPSGVVKTQLEARLKAVELATGRRPRGKQAKELKEEVVHTLLPRAFPKRSDTLVWIDLQSRRVLVAAGSAKKADAVVTRLVQLLDAGSGGEALRLAPLQTQVSPGTAMAQWLTEQQAPAGFSIDRDCELKQPDSEKAAVRYARHTLEIDEVAQHIQQGKLPTQLALTWAGRVSFMLAESGAIKKIKLLDVVLEGAPTRDEGGGFDADVAITTGELRGLLPDLIAALGGELQFGEAAVAPAAEADAAPAAGGAPATAPAEARPRSKSATAKAAAAAAAAAGTATADDTPPWDVTPQPA